MGRHSAAEPAEQQLTEAMQHGATAVAAGNVAPGRTHYHFERLQTYDNGVVLEVPRQDRGRRGADYGYLDESAQGVVIMGLFDGFGRQEHQVVDEAVREMRDDVRRRVVSPHTPFVPARALERINKEIAAVVEDGKSGASGVIGKLENGVFSWASVGRAECYLVRPPDTVSKQNKEHTARQELISKAHADYDEPRFDEDPRTGELAGKILTSALGTKAPQMEAASFRVKPGDTILFLTDGITGYHARSRMRGGNKAALEEVMLSTELTAEQKARALVELSTANDDKGIVIFEVPDSTKRDAGGVESKTGPVADNVGRLATTDSVEAAGHHAVTLESVREEYRELTRQRVNLGSVRVEGEKPWDRDDPRRVIGLEEARPHLHEVVATAMRAVNHFAELDGVNWPFNPTFFNTVQDLAKSLAQFLPHTGVKHGIEPHFDTDMLGMGTETVEWFTRLSSLFLGELDSLKPDSTLVPAFVTMATIITHNSEHALWRELQEK